MRFVFTNTLSILQVSELRLKEIKRPEIIKLRARLHVPKAYSIVKNGARETEVHTWLP